MKTLYLLRHAKSSWENPSLSDFDRPLNERGLLAAPLTGFEMLKRKLVPQMILSSPAVRALETAELVVKAGEFGSSIVVNDRIYEASPRCLLEVISKIDDERNPAMIVGHNPGMEGLIRILTGAVEPMPTAALAVLDLDIERWQDAMDGCGKTREVLRPRDIE